VPDLSYLDARRGQVRALVLTHGHEDHIGAVPYVLPHVDGPVYGPRLALAMIEPKLEEHRVTHAPGMIGVGPGQRVVVGPFTLEFLRVTHPRLPGGGHPHAAGRHSPHGRLQD
jgi:ribonuclease J